MCISHHFFFYSIIFYDVMPLFQAQIDPRDFESSIVQQRGSPPSFKDCDSTVNFNCSCACFYWFLITRFFFYFPHWCLMSYFVCSIVQVACHSMSTRPCSCSIAGLLPQSRLTIRHVQMVRRKLFSKGNYNFIGNSRWPISQKILHLYSTKSA